MVPSIVKSSICGCAQETRGVSNQPGAESAKEIELDQWWPFH
jgi:hypothetical protein